MPTSSSGVRRAAASTVATLFEAQVRQAPERLAATDGERSFSYGELGRRVKELAGALGELGVGRGDRIAVLSENRIEYLESFLAAASLGATVACQNWRLARPELAHCLSLSEPRVALVSPRFQAVFASTGHAPAAGVIELGPSYEALLARASPLSADHGVDPEEPLLVLYTSGTTGFPKGALISHRAQIVRNLVVRAEFGVLPEDTFVAWSPLYHMGAADCSIGALISGGTVSIVDGFDRERLAELVAREALGWLLLMPGMVAEFASVLEERQIVPRGVRLCGVMADLVPPAEIARITRLLGAPYANTFGATETGCPPCSSNRIPIGVAPARLSKDKSPFCEVKLVDANDVEVADGTPGELCIRGPTLFSGYYRADAVNEHEFRGGWFHMGDLFVKNADGSFDFVDRVKYLIKSGGENVYPAEIERVILQDPRVADAAVVRRPDPRWGEVPVAFVARRDPSLTEAEIYLRCRSELAGYKQPKAVYFIAYEDFPRSASGKIQRHELESREPRSA